MARTKKKKKKKKKTRRKTTHARTTKDGKHVAINVYFHVELLARLDDEATREDRSRRAQLERVLCRGFDIDPATLS